jgi:hypothetical protein
MAKFSSTNQPKSKGRKAGTVNKMTQLLRDNGEKFIVTAFKHALDDKHPQQTHWANVCAKLLPTPRSSMQPFVVAATGDHKADAKLITQAMLSGAIPADVAQASIATIRDSVTLVELEDLEKLLDRLLAEKGIKT